MDNPQNGALRSVFKIGLGGVVVGLWDQILPVLLWIWRGRSQGEGGSRVREGKGYVCEGGGGIIFHSLTLSAMHRSTCIRMVKTIEFDLAAKSQHPNKKK